MRKGFIFLALTLTLMFGIGTVSAQTEASTAAAQTNTSPVLAMLARIPDTPAAHDFLTYVDYPALIAARPGAPTIHSWTEYNTVISAKNAESALLTSALTGIKSGPDFFARYLFKAGDTPKVVGFDDFAIQQGVEYGTPPNQVVLLTGDFDAQAIVAAHEQRGYTESPTDGLTLLCSQAGCDQGDQLDMNNVNPANPFGGDLGRSQPVLVGDQFVASSPSIDSLNLAASTMAGKTPSLADQADYHAAAEAITANGTLLQTYFIAPKDIVVSLGAGSTSDSQATQIAQMLSTREAGLGTLPAYNLVALADSATNDEELALVAVVFTNEADAHAAAALFPDRLEKYISLRANMAFGNILTDSGVTSVDVSVISASTDRSVLLLTLHAPLPSTSIPDGETRPKSMSLAYSQLVQTYMSRDLGWLATQF